MTESNHHSIDYTKIAIDDLVFNTNNPFNF